MRKENRNKLALRRDTVYRLDPATLESAALEKAHGGIVSSDNRDCTYSRLCQEQAPGFE